MKVRVTSKKLIQAGNEMNGWVWLYSMVLACGHRVTGLKKDAEKQTFPCVICSAIRKRNR